MPRQSGLKLSLYALEHQFSSLVRQDYSDLVWQVLNAEDITHCPSIYTQVIPIVSYTNIVKWPFSVSQKKEQFPVRNIILRKS